MNNLKNAVTEGEILSALYDRLCEGLNIKPDNPPNSETVIRWWDDCPEVVFIEANDLLAKTMGESWHWQVTQMVVTHERMINRSDIHPEETNKSIYQRAKPTRTQITLWETPNNEIDDDQNSSRQVKVGGRDPSSFSIYAISGDGGIRNLREIHAEWVALEKKDERGKHPFAPILKAWIVRPKQSESENRKDRRILVRINAGPDTRPERRRGELLIEATRGEREIQAELFPMLEKYYVPLLDMVDRSGIPLKSSGRGATLESRIMIFAMLSMRIADWKQGAGLVSLPLREWLTLWYPRGFHRTNKIDKLGKTLESMERYGIPLPHRNSIWLPVKLREVWDRNMSMDSMVTFDVAMPPGTADNGPPIDLQALARLGIKSSPQWRACIAGHTITWIPGITQRPVPKAPGRYGWSRKIEDYPVVSQPERRRIGFGEDAKGNPTHKQVNQAWEELPGLVIADKEAFDPKTQIKGWRVVPIKAWKRIQESKKIKT